MDNKHPLSNWNLGKTKAIRVPEVIADVVLNFAKRIDTLATDNDGLTQEDREQICKSPRDSDRSI